jgi:hypothetical protein
MSETVLNWALSKEVNTFVDSKTTWHIRILKHSAFCFMTVINKPLETDIDKDHKHTHILYVKCCL